MEVPTVDIRAIGLNRRGIIAGVYMLALLLACDSVSADAAGADLHEQVVSTMRKAAGFFRTEIDSRLDDLETRYDRLRHGAAETAGQTKAALEQQVRQIINALDEQGRWVSTYHGERLVGQPKSEINQLYIASEVFSRNIETLGEFLMQTRPN